MRSSILRGLGLIFAVIPLAISQAGEDQGYFGYSLHERDNSDGSVVFQTNSTDTSNGTTSNSIIPPDVYLNASVSVAEISLQVLNITARINLEAQVLSLLKFNAGVDISIDRVSLLIENVVAKVFLEARLENIVLMIGDVLDSLDLNPVLATLGQDLGTIVNATVSGVGGALGLSKRDFELANNILYSVNDYSGNTHTNRILAQNGSLVDQSVNNDGHVTYQRIVGYYARDMTFNGYNVSVVNGGKAERELEYVYTPFFGLSVVSAIYTDAKGNVVATQVLAESGGGASSSVGAEL